MHTRIAPRIAITALTPALVVASALVTAPACHHDDPAADAAPPIADAAPIADAPGAIDAADPQPLTRDCTADDPLCPALAITGDLPATTPARGFADPSMRRDPSSGTLWLAYSWPYSTPIPSGGGVVTVDNHLAHSVDGGATWSFDGPMWTATAATSPVDGADGYYNQETVSLAPRTTAAGVIWYSARLHYFTDAAGPKVASFQIHVARAASPGQLAAAPEAALGGALSAPVWGPVQNLAALSPALAGCTWNDPGILVDGDVLYLAVECQRFTAQGEDTDNELVAVFATDPTGPVDTWTWSYRGVLTDHADAVELGGTNLLQSELTRAQDGTLLLVASPSEPATPLATHFGCRAVEIASLDPPTIDRFGDGRLRVRASATASDLAPAGPGSCTYEPTSSTGLLLVRRVLGPHVLDNTLNATALRP